MPLINDDISRGKCGFKAIQYMSLGIPAVVSPVGVNSTIIENGVNGYLCHNIEDWIKSIEILLVDSQLRETIGIQARTQIETLYSVEATTEQFINQFS
jgi:glycosyltransferase involved in cell wall biosynthesis